MKNSQENTLGLALGGGVESGYAFTTSGLPSQNGIITQPTNKEAQLSELLSSLENGVENLESRYYEVLNTFLDALDHLVRLGSFTKDITITREGEGV